MLELKKSLLKMFFNGLQIGQVDFHRDDKDISLIQMSILHPISEGCKGVTWYACKGNFYSTS